MNYFKYLIFFSIMSHTVNVHGQDEEIFYPQHMENWLKEHVAQNQNIRFKQSGDIVLVPVKVHLVSNDDGSEAFLSSRLLARLCELNANFEETGFHFYLYGDIHFIQDDILNNHTDIEDILPLIETTNAENAINVYYVNSPISVCGYVHLPEMDDPEFIMLNHNNSCNGINSLLLTRNMGSYFALPRTFNGWSHFDTPDTPEYVTRDPNLRNCHEAGDFFCDTDADYLYLQWQPPFNPANFPGATVTDPMGDTIHPDAELFMNAIQPQQAFLPSRFSDEQMNAMHAYLFDERDYLIHPDPPQIIQLTDVPDLTYPQSGMSQAANYSQLKWTGVNNAEDYNVEIASNASFTNIIKDTIVSDTSVVFQNLPENSNLYWRVKAFNKTSFCSVTSNTETFSTTQSVSFTVSVETHFCADANSGEIIVEADGDHPPFNIQISGGQFSGLSAGKYDVTITDANQESLEIEVDLFPYPELIVQIQQGNYALTANVSGGKPPYEYLWSNGSNDSIIENLTSGTYTVTVTDASGCETIETAEATNIAELEKLNSHLTVYPNPVFANQNVYIKMNSPSATSANYAIFNMQGKKVRSGNFELVSGRQSLSLQLKGFTPGVFLLRLISGDNTYNTRIVVIE